jgi:sigma-B regulation protein RsbU (phosphoserine phosphatase)
VTAPRIKIALTGLLAEQQRDLIKMLTALGYQTVVVNSELTDQLENAALLLLGQHGVNRADVVEMLKTSDTLRSLPIIIVEDTPKTGKSVVETPLQTLQHNTDLDVCFAFGADDYVMLPTRSSLLRQRVDIALERCAFRAYETSKSEREMLAKLERDVQIGRQIQASFLPSKLPQPEGWEIAARFHPAREVAGDFYDSFYVWNKRRVAIIVADVSDKGIPAALFMAIFRTLLRAGSLYGMKSIRTGEDMLSEPMEPIKEQKDWAVERPGQRPRKLPTIGLSQLESVPSTNAYMANTHGIDAYFVTLFFGILDPRTGDLIYVNGGHNPPIVLREDGEHEKLKPTGPAVGILPEAKFRYAHTKLQPGDVLFAYTDGVPEARAPNHEFFTDDRMMAAISQDTSSAAAVLESVEDALEDFDAYTDQFDDVTMMSVRYCPKTHTDSPSSDD